MLRLLKTAGAVMRHTGISPGLMLRLSKLAIKDDSTNFLLFSQCETSNITGLSKLNRWPGFCCMWVHRELVARFLVMSVEWPFILSGRLRPVSPK